MSAKQILEEIRSQLKFHESEFKRWGEDSAFKNPQDVKDLRLRHGEAASVLQGLLTLFGDWDKGSE